MRRLDPKGSVGNVLTTKLSRISSFRRHISLNTAIQRGLLDEDASRKHRSRGRKDQDELDEEINRPPEPHWSYRKELSPTNHPDKDFGFKAARRSQDDRRESATVHTKSSSTDSLWRRRKRDDFSHREGHRTSHGRQDVPHKLPFTTATSEFLYGRSTVIAALKARRRKFYNLYLHPRAIEGESESKETLQDLAATAHVGRVKLVNSDWLPLMDEASNDRPHNGCILEASPLPQPVVQSLSIPGREPSTGENGPRDYFKVVRASLTKETLANVYYSSDGWRYPAVLFLHNIVDTGNLGAIIRSAYWFGIDAIALSSRGCATLDAAGLRASAGAAEAVPLLTVENPDAFLSQSRADGWQVLAAMPPPESLPTPVGQRGRSGPRPMLIPRYATSSHPLILMLGGESKGIERHLMKHVDAFLTIKPYADTSTVGLDSLNVSVASALILSKVMRQPNQGAIYRLRKTFGTARHSKSTVATGLASKEARDEEGDFMIWSTPR